MIYCLLIRALLFARIKEHPVANLEGALDLKTYLHLQVELKGEVHVAGNQAGCRRVISSWDQN